METIIVLIKPDGSLQIEVNGVKGPSCSLATKAFEAALGRPQSTTLKPEYHDSPGNLNKIGGR